jgi:hypothetical protein
MENDPDPIFWVWTVTAVVVAILLLYSFAALAESCGPACTDTRFVPHINGIPVEGLEDFDAFDCERYLDEILDPQTPPFTRLECIEEPIARTEL